MPSGIKRGVMSRIKRKVLSRIKGKVLSRIKRQSSGNIIRNMKKKYIILDIIALASLLGAYVTKNYADKKLGFVRWLNFNGNKLRENYPTETIKYIAAAAALVLCVWALYRLIRKRQQLTVPDKIMAVVMTAVTLYYMYATCTILYTVTPSSFLLVPLIGLSAYLLIICNLLRAGDSDI